ncbi:MAG TPA: hypothetical protein VFY65_17455, partial [Longimicrobium sp.]|nr:hypothetical protein [Longimicrobium sp.]
MKFIYRQAEVSRITAHFVQRNQAVKTIKSGVFQTFGHYRPGQLLKAPAETFRIVGMRRGALGDSVSEKDRLDEFVHTVVGQAAE